MSTLESDIDTIQGQIPNLVPNTQIGGTTLGLVKNGGNVTIESDGTMNVSSGSKQLVTSGDLGNYVYFVDNDLVITNDILINVIYFDISAKILRSDYGMVQRGTFKNFPNNLYRIQLLFSNLSNTYIETSGKTCSLRCQSLPATICYDDYIDYNKYITSGQEDDIRLYRLYV